MVSSLVFAALSAAVVAQSPPDTVGRFEGFTRRLPDSKLPVVPLLGNGALGVLIDAHDNVHAAHGGGRDNTVDIWLGSGSFWSCGACNTLAKGCCRLVSLGGLSVSLLPTFPRATYLNFYAEQRVGPGQLYARMSTPTGGNLSVLVSMHPSEAVVVANLSWAPGAGDPAALIFNASLWVAASSNNGANPAPASVGCLDAATRQPVACSPSALADAQLLFVSRKAATNADSSRPVWAGLAARCDGAAGPTSFAVTASASGDVWESTLTATVAAGGAAVSILVGEAEVVGGSADPALAAAERVASASAAAVAAAAAGWWDSYWAGGARVSLPSLPDVEALWDGAQYLLAATASSDPRVPPPGLYGVWATSDGCSWNGDYTLDYNAEATYFGAFSSNHAAQTASYFDYLLAWVEPGRAMAAQLAAGYGITCDNETLHYACHLAPWGYQSFDETYYMHWNGHFSTLLFINAWEYTLNTTLARDVLYPYLNGHVLWWACSLNKTRTGPGPNDYVYRDVLHDAEHEGQLVDDPQIGLAFAARTIRAQLDMARALGLSPPPLLVDIDAHLTPFNRAKWNYSAPANATYTLFSDARFSDDDGMTTGVATLAACEALCTSEGDDCPLFTFCPNTSVSGCDLGESCWRYSADKASTLHAGAGFTSGRKDGPPPPAVTLDVWSAFAGATMAQSDSFALYPLWPTEFAGSTGAAMDAATAAIAQASARAYIKWAGGRSVDVFSSAVLAAQGYTFPPARGGSVVQGGPPAPDVALSPSDVLDGFAMQIKLLFGGNLLLYAEGGGVENIGVSRAVNEMLATSIGGVGGVVTLFPFWPATQPAAFERLLVKGGVAVTASYDNATAAVTSPVIVTAAYTLAGADTATVRLADPWSTAGQGGGITANCGGVATPISWTGSVMSFAAPAGIACSVALPAAPSGAGA